jgi:hypothetical protein
VIAPAVRRFFGLVLVATSAAALVVQFGRSDPPRTDPVRAISGAAEHHALVAYSKQPLAFVVNEGQTDASVRYYAQGLGFTIFLTRADAILALQPPRAKGKRRGAAIGLASSAQTATSPFAPLARRLAASTTSSAKTAVSGARVCGPTNALPTATSGRASISPSTDKAAS